MDLNQSTNSVNMDSWRDVLLEWANCTELLNRSYQKLPKIDINAFYAEFRRRAQPLQVDELAVLRDFIKTMYPDYIGSPSTADARSVQLHRWSLLLHYSCVQCPLPDIQQRCSALSPSTQRKLERFFTVLISRPTIDREHLSAAIAAAAMFDSAEHGTNSSSCTEAEATDMTSPLRIVRNQRRTTLAQQQQQQLSAGSPSPLHQTLGSLSIGGSSGCGGVLSTTAGTSGQLMGMGMSPMPDRATPKSASTPRTKMMDEWNWEIRQLRAQIDTERDERQFLEGQLKQSEEKIATLINERKVLTHSNHELQNQLLAVDTENVSPNRNHQEEQVKRRLRKDIADRDRRIDDLSATIEQQNDVTATLRLRHQSVEKQLANQEKRSQDLLTMFEEQNTVIEQNAVQLAELRNTNSELELYMQELRRHAGRTGVDAAGPRPRSLLAECAEPESFDASMDAGSAEHSPPTAPTTPDNLGRTVVDMRLREQQMRNQQLEEQLAQQADEAHAALAAQAEQHAAEVQAAVAELRSSRADNERLDVDRRQHSAQHMRELSEAAAELRAEHAAQCARWQRDRVAADAEMADLLTQVTRLNALNGDLLRQMGERDVRIEALSAEGSALMERREQLAAELVAVQQCAEALRSSVADHERVRGELETNRGRLEETVRGLRTQVDILETAQETLRAETNEGMQQLQLVREAKQQMEGQLRRAEAKSAEVLAENERLSKSQVGLSGALEEADRVRQSLEAETTSLKTFNEDHIRQNATLQSDCVQLREQLATAQSHHARLERDNADYLTEHTKYQHRIATIESACAAHEASSASLKHQLDALNAQNTQLQSQLDASVERLQRLTATELELQQKLTDCQSVVADLSGERDALRQSGAVSDDLNRHLSAERVQLLDRTAELGKQLIDQRDEFAAADALQRQQQADLRQQLADLRRELVEITETLSAEAGDIERLTVANRCAEADRDAAHSERNAMAAARDKLEASNAELSASVARLSAQLDAAKRTTVTSEQSLLALQQQYETMRAHIVESERTAERRCQQLRDELDDSAASRVQLERSRDAATADGSALLLRLIELRTADKMAQSASAAAEQRLRDEHVALEERITASDAELQAVQVAREQAEERCAQLEAKLGDMQREHSATMEGLVREQQSAEQCVLALRGTLAKHSEHAEQLDAEVVALKAERAAAEVEWRRASSELEARLSAVEDECACKLSEIEELRAQSIEQAEQRRAHEQRIAELSVELEQLRSAGVERSAQAEEAHAQRIGELNTEIESKRADVQRLESRLTSVEAECAAKLSDIDELRSAATEHADQRLAHEQRITALSIELEKLRTSGAEMSARSAQMEESYEQRMRVQLAAERESKETLIAELSTQMTSVIEQSTVAKRQHEEIVEQHAAERQANQQRIEELLAAQTEAKRQHAEMAEQQTTERLSNEQRTAELRTEIVALQALLAEQNDHRVSFQQRIADLDQLQQSSHSDATRSENRIVALSAEIGELQADRDRLLQTHEQRSAELAGESERLQRELSASQALHTASEERCSELKADLDSLKHELSVRAEQLQATKAQCTGDIERLTTEHHHELNKHQHQAAQAALQLATAHGERDRIAAQLVLLNAEHRRQLTAVQDDLKTSHQEVADRSTQMEKLRAELADLKGRHTVATAQMVTERLQQDIEQQRMRDDLAKCSNDRDAAAALVRHHEAEIAELQQERDQSAKSATEALAGVRLEKVEFEAKCEQLNAEQATLRAEYAELQAKWQLADVASVAAHTELDQERAARQRLNDNLVKFEQQIQLLEEEKEQLNADIVVAMQSKQRVDELEAEAAQTATLQRRLDEWQCGVGAMFAEWGGKYEIGADSDDDTTSARLKRLRDTIAERFAGERNAVRAERDRLAAELVGVRDDLSAAQLRYEAVEHQYELDERSKRQRQQQSESDDQQRLIEMELKLTTAEQRAMVLEQQYAEQVSVLRAKLMKEREDAKVQQLDYEKRMRRSENRVTETRSELECKLEKMKERMRDLYSLESAKVKARHEVELSDLAKRNAEIKADQLAAFENQVHSMSKEIFKLNEQNLEERKQNEQLRSRLHMLGHGGGAMMRPSLNVGRESMRVMPASSMSSLIKMEDEEGEQFTNTYLNDLITGGGGGEARAAAPGRTLSTFGGRYSPPSTFFGGSNSVPLSELKKRNSMVPQHLRSSYAVQYTDTFSTEDDIKEPISLPADDSMFSTGSDVRRSTMYQRPGPPTPSKHSARLSMGSTVDQTGMPAMHAPAAVTSKPQTQLPEATSKLRAFFAPSKSSSTAAAASRDHHQQNENSPPKRRLSNMFKLK